MRGFVALLALSLGGCGLGEFGAGEPPSREQTRNGPPLAASASASANARNEAAVEGRVVLVREGELGIPFHTSPDSHTKFSRVASGTRATIVGPSSDPKLLFVRLASGEEGYVAPRYVRPEGEGAKPKAGSNPSAGSREACERAYRENKPVASDTPRLGTFNVRWFPDGGPGESEGKRTDVAWLACVLAGTGSDVIALQEWKTTGRAKKATEELLGALSTLSGSPWKIELDECTDRGAQHVGILWNTERVRVENARTEGVFNPKGSACEGRLRPGVVARVVPNRGKAFEFGSLHLKSGTDRVAYDLRSKSFEAILAFAKEHVRKEPSVPLVLAGDLNTMGCEDCEPKIREADERKVRDAALALASGALEPDAPACSHYYEGKPGLLDGFIAWGGRVDRVRAFGECAVRSCAKGSRETPYFGHVSDHCPLAVELGSDLRP